MYPLTKSDGSIGVIGSPQDKKAGPGSLAEANAAQLPVVVYDYVPGQERGNVDFVRNNGLGAIALHGAGQVVQAVRTLIRTPHRLEEIRRNQELVAPVRSSRRIAALIAQIANTGTIPAQDEETVRQVYAASTTRASA